MTLRIRPHRLLVAGLTMPAMAVLALAPTPAAAAAAVGTGNWPMYGDGPTHTSDNRAETVLGPSSIGGFHITATWNYFSSSVPTVVGNTAYVVTSGSSRNFLTAISLPSGAQRWRRFVSAGTLCITGGDPAVSGGVVYVGAGNPSGAEIKAFSTAGALLWTTPLGVACPQLTPLTVAGGVIYAASYHSQTVYALQASTGHLLWSVSPSGCCLLGAVTVAGGLAYISDGQRLLAYNAATGAPAFSSPPASDPGGTVTIVAGKAIVQATNHVWAYDAANGAPLWSAVTETGNTYSSLTPASDGSTVVVGTTRHVMAFAVSNGAPLWSYDSGSDSTDYAAPVLANGLVYAPSVGLGLQVLDEHSGHLDYTGASLCSGVVVSHGSAYAPCFKGLTVFGL